MGGQENRRSTVVVILLHHAVTSKIGCELEMVFSCIFLEKKNLKI